MKKNLSYKETVIIIVISVLLASNIAGISLRELALLLVPHGEQKANEEIMVLETQVTGDVITVIDDYGRPLGGATLTGLDADGNQVVSVVDANGHAKNVFGSAGDPTKESSFVFLSHSSIVDRGIMLPANLIVEVTP